jgi:hypothetical protein
MIVHYLDECHAYMSGDICSNSSATSSKPHLGVLVSNGNGTDFAIGNDDHLYMVDYTGYRIDLGIFNKARLEQLRFNLGQLEAFAK